MLLDDAKKPGGDQSWCSNDGCKDIKDAAGVTTKKNAINTNKAGWVAVAAAAGCAVVGSAILIPYLKKRAQSKFEDETCVMLALVCAGKDCALRASGVICTPLPRATDLTAISTTPASLPATPSLPTAGRRKLMSRLPTRRTARRAPRASWAR